MGLELVSLLDRKLPEDQDSGLQDSGLQNTGTSIVLCTCRMLNKALFMLS